MMIPPHGKNSRLVTAVLFALAALIARSAPGFADEPSAGIYPARVAVIAEPQASPPLAALAGESLSRINRTFNALGRLLPEEGNRIGWALSSVGANGAPFERHLAAAKLLGADLLVTVSFTGGPRVNYADLRVRAINPEFSSMDRSVRVRSRVLQNIPLKLAREIAFLHRGVPVRARVLGRTGDGLLVINAGEWNGLAPGKTSTSRGEADIRQTGMYHSLIAASGAKDGDTLSIPAAYGADTIIREMEERLEKNSFRTYGLPFTLLKNQDDERRFVTGTCIVNPGGNLCLGGYGAFLSTEYLGFQNPSPATGGIIASSAAYAVQLALVPAMSRFEANFFPWERDSDKPARLQDLHMFLWCSIPLTFSAGFFDQLAYQYHKSEHLPPFFLYRDNMAAILSIIVPGGGLFYKGHRVAGWSYYFAEMGLAGYAIYNWDNGSRGKYALGALGVIKTVELLHAYFMPAGFRFFNMEMEREIREVSLNFEMRPNGRDEAVWDLAAVRRF
ncbi:MAG: hypothetical protein KBA61_10740 [Spirochaetes bacterium]|nr:hypothetical protein [Spirochaetota bacterium]